MRRFATRGGARSRWLLPTIPPTAFSSRTRWLFRRHRGHFAIGRANPSARNHRRRGDRLQFGFDVRRITAPGTLDGGDILKVGDIMYVARSGRTNGEGIRQLRAVYAPLGVRVIAVPLTKVLHLKTAVTALPDGTIIGWPPALDDPRFFPHFIAMPEESGSHVVLLGGDLVLMADNAPRSADLISDLGYTPVPVDISEFEKLEGCVTCLSVRLRDIPSAEPQIR